ncbi:unnamed protein product [Dicrocoelium dendriticum]|nr:unnamed protein product [Dicrocoelium dendriticum]
MQSNGYHSSHFFLIFRASESEACQDGLKSDEVAHNHRNKSLASRGEMLTKLDSSTEAIFAANTTGCRSMGYNCRSQLLQSLAANEAELGDLTRCFENDPPVVERRNLLHRRGIALRKLGQFHEARAAFLEAKFATRFRCSEDVPESVLDENLRQCDNQDSSDRNMHPPLIFHSKPSTGFQITENISFTDCISQEPGSFRIRSNGLLGWNLVANRDIIPGELIAAEKPYVRVLNPGKELRHCYHCCKRSLSLIPCRNCSEVGFCSAQCERDTWTLDWWHMSQVESHGEIVDRPDLDQFHRFECGQRSRITLKDVGGLLWLQGSGGAACTSSRLQRYHSWLRQVTPIEYPILDVSDFILAFACVARTPWRTIWRLARGQPDDSNKKIAHSGNSLRPRSSLFAFSGHETVPAAVIRTGTYESVSWRSPGRKERSVEDLWQRTVAAVFLAHCLSAGGYPLDWEDDPMLNPSHALTGEDRSALPASWAAACLLYHLQADMRATRCQTVVCQEQDAVNSSGTVCNRIQLTPVSRGIYALLSLTSHSCSQISAIITVDEVGEGLFAYKTIRAGEEISFSLCNNYYGAARQEILLKRFGFHCDCLACCESWPVKLVAECTLRCKSCGKLLVAHGRMSTTPIVPTECRCQLRIRGHRLSEIMQQYDLQIAMPPTIIRGFENVPLPHISGSVLDRRITEVVKKIRVLEQHELFREPCGILTTLKDQLHILLNSRYGQHYTLSALVAETRDPPRMLPAPTC